MPETAGFWNAAALVAEDLVPVPEPLLLALQPGAAGAPADVAGHAARALLDLPEVAPQPPAWLIPHQVPAFTRLHAVMRRYGGALLADAVGLGKSYVALAVALELREPIGLVVPAVLVTQWRRLLDEKGARAEILTHESLSRAPFSSEARLLVVDEAHRFRNPDTMRYRHLAAMCIGRRVLLVTATPVHNRLADLFHLFRLFLRDDALTALGLGSLARAGRGEVDPALLAGVAARLIVARSRARAPRASFPTRTPGLVLRAATAPADHLVALVRDVTGVALGGHAAPLLRLTLLQRLASSMAAFRSTVARYRAFAELAADASRSGHRLCAADFQRLFPRGQEPDVQLTLLPLILDAGVTGSMHDGPRLARLEEAARTCNDPKAEALEGVLAARAAKTIVFTAARETARYLLRRLGGRFRVAAVTGSCGWFGAARAAPREVLAAFAPRSQGAADPPAALATDVLIATDLVSEGLNLQDAACVVHYDLPWNPARLAQRVGRIDRLGSAHGRVATIAFLPPPELAAALALERRLTHKLAVARTAGTAQRETVAGPDAGGAGLDWCDRLQLLASRRGAGSVAGWDGSGTVLIVRLGDCCEAIVVDAHGARAAPADATAVLESAVTGGGAPADREAVAAAVRIAAPLIRERLAALATARWRAPDRDRLARRLIPWVLTAGRRAARRGDAPLLQRLDAVITRLTQGMTSGEELALRALVERPERLTLRDMVRWHGHMPPLTHTPEAPRIELVAALVSTPNGR